MKILNNRINKIVFILFCLFISFITLYFCSKNSFRYEYNDWVDCNAFFTVGKSWMHGLLPYKDLFEQKGPLLYLIYGIASLISPNNYHIVYIIEAIFFSLFLYYNGKISDLYLSKISKYAIIPLVSGTVCSSIYFTHGGSAEELLLPFFAISLYYYLKYLTKDNFEISPKALFINGFIAGIIAMTKFNLLGFHFIFMASIFFIMLRKKKIKEAFLSCIYFISGMSILPIIFIIYFAWNNSISEFINVYIIYNISGYIPYNNLSTFSRIIIAFYKAYYEIYQNIYLIFLTCFTLYFILNNKIVKTNTSKLCLIINVIFLAIGIFIGIQSWDYYFLPLLIYVILAFISIFDLIQLKNINERKTRIVIILCIFISIFLISKSPNISFNNKYKKSVQYKFAKKMNEDKNVTLLNYGYLDSGFYQSTNVLPNVKVFEIQNGDRQKFIKIQKKYIKEKKVKYVVTIEEKDKQLNVKELKDNYKEINYQQQKFENVNYIYRLWKQK